MNTEHFQAFDPGIHATSPRPRYEGDEVVVRPIPLQDITFRPGLDILPDLEQDATTCPWIQTLEAQPSVPPIDGLDSNQQLKVSCAAQRTTPYNGTAWRTCRIRAAQQGIDISNENGALRAVANPEIEKLTSCPFIYLAGVTGPDQNIPVAVSARHPSLIIST